MPDPNEPSTDWADWHQQYADPASSLSQRLAVVVGRVRQALDELPAGPVRLISVCAGQGHDVVGALRGHPRADDVHGWLVELDEHNVAAARAALAAAHLDRLEVVHADASSTDAYVGRAPADLLLLCGIFGNVSDDDVRGTIEQAPMLCTAGAYVVWTRHRRTPDLTPAIRGWFADAGFDEVSFDSPGPDGFSVGMAVRTGTPMPLSPGRRLFSFVR